MVIVLKTGRTIGSTVGIKKKRRKKRKAVLDLIYSNLK